MRGKVNVYDNKVNNELEYKAYSCEVCRQLFVVKLHNDQISGYSPSAEKFNSKADLSDSSSIPEKIRSRFEGVIVNHNIDIKIVKEHSLKLVSSERGIDDPYMLTKIINLIAPKKEKPTKDSLENIQLPQSDLIWCTLIFIGFAEHLPHATRLSHSMALHFLDCYLAHAY